MPLCRPPRSVGYISQTLTAAGRQATVYNLSVTVPLPILGEADEIFQGRKPCLTLVDGALVPGGEPDACGIPRRHNVGHHLLGPGGVRHPVP
jgi:hypothetical protein